jgi:hypothetical protein
MEYAANKDVQEARIRSDNEFRNRQLSLQEQAQKDAASAANVSGIASIGQLGLEGYLGYKYLTKAPSALEIAQANYLKGLTPSTTPVVNMTGAGVGSGGLLPASGAGVGSGVPLMSAANAAPTAPSLTAGLSGAEYGGGVGAASEGSIFSAATPYLAPVGAGILGGKLLGPTLDKILPGGGKAGKAIGGAAGGAATGAAIGSIIPGVGTAVGGVVGGIIGGGIELIEDASVVCSELLRQGRITERQRTTCVVFRFRHIPDDMFSAYLEWAKPHVEAMRKGGWRNMVRLPFARAFVGYMIAVQEKRKPSFSERMVWKYAWNRCEIIARREALGVKAVA